MSNNNQFGNRQWGQYWQGYAVAWRRSGQSQAEYCRQQALEIKRFGYWQRKNLSWRNRTLVIDEHFRR